MRRLLLILVVLVTVAYPFLVYWGLQHFEARYLLPVVVLLLALRWLAQKNVGENKAILLTLVGILLVTLFWGGQLGLKFYPVLVNFSFLLLFFTSLFSPMTVVERMARIREPDLPERAIVYTRNVTKVWCGFFLINGSIAAATALWGSEETWMIYNGFIAYVLIGILAGGEWLVRQRVKRS